MVRRVVLAAVAAIVGMAFVMAPATAASTVTKMRLELASKEIAVGTQLGGSVSLWARSGSSWVPVMGATLSVLVDGRNTGTVVTDEGGSAVVSVPPDLTPGRHVMKIVYAGNGVYSRTQRSQGLSVTSGSEPTTCTAAPDAPVLLGADTTVLGTVTLTWSPPANDGGCPIVAYRVYRGPELVGSASGSATSYVDTAVPSGVHWYTVTAANADYVSAPSNEIFVSI